MANSLDNAVNHHDVKVVDFQSPQAGPDFAESLHVTGFAVLKDHPLDMNLVRKVYQEWRGFLNNPSYSHKYLYSGCRDEGYFPPDVAEKVLNF